MSAPFAQPRARVPGAVAAAWREELEALDRQSRCSSRVPDAAGPAPAVVVAESRPESNDGGPHDFSAERRPDAGRYTQYTATWVAATQSTGGHTPPVVAAGAEASSGTWGEPPRPSAHEPSGASLGVLPPPPVWPAADSVAVALQAALGEEATQAVGPGVGQGSWAGDDEDGRLPEGSSCSDDDCSASDSEPGDEVPVAKQLPLPTLEDCDATAAALRRAAAECGAPSRSGAVMEVYARHVASAVAGLAAHRTVAGLVASLTDAMAAYAGAHARCARQLRRAGAVHELGSCLKVHATSAASPHAALGALNALFATCGGPACTKKSAQTLCAAGCVDATLSLVRGHVHGEPQVGQAACAALATWCRTSRRVAAHAAAAGAVACVLTTMRAHRTAAHVATAACAALASLTGGHCHAGKVASDALLAGAAAEVVAAMRDHDSHAELQLTACRTLRLLCTRAAQSGTAGAHIALVGGLYACVVASGLYAADTALCTAALRACGALIRTGGAAVHAQAMAADVPAATVYVWRLHGGTQRRCAAAACSVLVALLEVTPAAESGDALTCDLVVSAGAPQLAVQALQRHGASHSPGLCLSCTRLLALCTRKAPAGPQGEHILAAVTAAMRRHTSHAGVAAAGAECVRQVAQALPPGATARAGAAEVVVAVMACHASDAAIALATAAAMTSLAGQKEHSGEGGSTAVRLVVAGAMHALAACMHAHCGETDVTASAAEACVAVLAGVLRAGAPGTEALQVAFTSGAGDAAIACLGAAGADDAAVSVQAVTLLAVLFEAQSALDTDKAALVPGTPRTSAVALIASADSNGAGTDAGDSQLSMANALGAATQVVAQHGDSNTQLCTSYARLVASIAKRSVAGAGAALAAGCAEALVRCMDAHAGNAVLAHSVATAFASLATGPGGGRVAKTGVRVCCDALRVHGSHRRDVAVAAAAALAGLCKGHHPSCAVAAAAGAPSALCVALRAHCSHPDAVAAAARCLAVLASHEACVHRCGDADALEALVTALALQPHSAEVARAVGAALAATAEAAEAGDAGGRATVNSLGSAGAPVLGAPSAPLQTGAVPEVRRADPCMALSCACALLASHGTADPGVAVHGCRAIAALMPRASASKPADGLPRRGAVPGETAAELAAKAMPLLLLVLSAHAASPDARDAACRALAAVLVAPAGTQPDSVAGSALSVVEQPLGVRALDLGAMSLCLDALEDAPRDAGVQASGLELLCALLDGASGGSATLSGAATAEAAVSAAVADGAVELVVASIVNHGGGGAGGAGGGGTALMLSLAQATGHAARVIAPALGVLARMAAMGHTHGTLVDTWAVRFLVQALSVHGPASPEVATPGCVAIANLCSIGTAPVRDEVAAAGAVTAVVEVLTACGTKHPGVAAAACDALRALAADADIEVVAAYAGALEAVAAALAVFGNVAAVQESGLAAAACICWSHPDVAAHGREVGLPLLARASLDTRWKGHARIRDAAQLVLTKLGEPASLSATDALNAMGEATGVHTVARAARDLAQAASATRQEEGVTTPEPPPEPDVLTWQEDSAIRAAVTVDEDEEGEEGQFDTGMR